MIAPTGNAAIAFLVSAGVSYEVIAKDCSSPQTAELNADKRAPTLMKWVKVGIVEAAAVTLVAVLIDPKLAKPMIAGAAVACGITWVEYEHAKRAGLASAEPPTEDY